LQIIKWDKSFKFYVEDTEENIHFKHTKENLYKIIPSTKEINYI
jgi:hypothetical protein